MNGFINLLKPPGMSSGNAVAFVKRLTGERVGHAGTLDPEAAGVLPVMVGRATRLLDYFSEKEKTYIGEAAFTGATDTQDAQGVVVESGRGRPTQDALRAALEKLTGEIDQRPPAYSALKREGQPLYKLARQGVQVETQPRRTVVHGIDVLCDTTDGCLMRIRCGGGTYIRTLCHDLGQLTGCPAHMRFLLRTQVGAFHIENAVTLEALQAAREEDRLPALLLPMDTPLAHLPRVDVPDRLSKQAANGVALPLRALGAESLCGAARVYLQGELLGIGRPEGDLMKFSVIVRGHDKV